MAPIILRQKNEQKQRNKMRNGYVSSDYFKPALAYSRFSAWALFLGRFVFYG
jgi:hypothetical protein